MAAAPIVRDLNTLIGEIGAAYAPQKELINQQIAAADQSGTAQRAGLAAQQKQSFGQIEQGAQNKGMFFSGFAPDAQAKYTATTYLPALANLESSINQVKTGLYGKTAELDSQTRTQAFNVREGDVAAQRAWQADQEQRAYQAEQQRLQMEAQAREASANRAAQARSSAGASNKNSGLVSKLNDYLKSKSGKDGFTHPVAFQNARAEWVGAGGDPQAFNATFAAKVNPNHPQSYGIY